MILVGIVGYGVYFVRAGVYVWREAPTRSEAISGVLRPWRFNRTPYISGMAISVLIAMVGVLVGKQA